MNRISWQVPVALGCLFLGILIAILFRSQQSLGPPPTKRIEEMAFMVRDLEKENNKLTTELGLVRSRVGDLEKSLSEGSSKAQAMMSLLESAKIQAGLVPLVGPGISVVLRDSPKRPKAGEDSWFFVIHDVDLEALVNELWAAGAEAVAVNNQRIAANSAIRCAGPVILVNYERLSPPYTVKGIGPAGDMESAVRMQGGFLDSMAPSIRNGVEIKISQEQSLQLPAYKGSTMLRYARPMKEEEVGL